MIRNSISISKSKSVSPSLSISPSSSPPTSPVIPTDDMRSRQLECTELLCTSDHTITLQMRRLMLENTFPSCSFGRHTSLKMTPYRCRHFAVSRFHFSIAFLPNHVVDDFDHAFAQSKSTSTTSDVTIRGKRRGGRKGAASASSPSLSRLTYTDEQMEGSFCLFNWSSNPLYINEATVPCSGRGFGVLCEGDVISLLVSAFDPANGIMVRDQRSGRPLLRSEAESVPSSPSPSPVVTIDYDPFDSPIRKGTSIRHPAPLPVFLVTRRAPSPEVSMNTRRRSTSMNGSDAIEAPPDFKKGRRER
jgi:hypothetical protein